MEVAALIAVSWASGINAYLTVFLLGAGGRLGWIDTPAGLQQWWVIVLAAALGAVEFFVDKVPYVDNLWDAVHTVIRPTVAALVGISIAGAQLGQTEAALLAAGIALTGHAVKASTRLAVNASPEPASNWVLSFGEDGMVVGMVALAAAYPRVAAAVAILAMLLGIVVAVVSVRLIRRGWRRVRSWFGPQPEHPGRARTRRTD